MRRLSRAPVLAYTFVVYLGLSSPAQPPQNYILLAGPEIFQDIFARPSQHPELEEGIGKWLAWRKRIEEIAESKGVGSALGRAAYEAHCKMNYTVLH